MSPKEFYSTYVADDSTSELTDRLVYEIHLFNPVHVLEFGCGSGKNIKLLQDGGVCVTGLDISFINVIRAQAKNEIKNVIYGDETHLRHLCNFDVVFTCSVIDHIESPLDIIDEFKRIANKAVILAETRDIVGPHYFSHKYESLGFTKVDYCWKSREGDGASYFIWVWQKGIDSDFKEYYDKRDSINDDLG